MRKLKYLPKSVLIGFTATLILSVLALRCQNNSSPTNPNSASELTVVGYNDLGMHCMNQDFSEFMILPPFNTLHAQVVERASEHPRIVTQGILVAYEIPGNTISSTKTNFWDFAHALLGVTLAKDAGLTGHGLSGTMAPTGKGDWSVTGIPITPLTDAMQENSFQQAAISVKSADGQQTRGATTAVVPVSWEIRCDLCHHGAPDAPKSVLQAHDLLHGTHLYDSITEGPAGATPVLCGECHGQPALGLSGKVGVHSLSLAIHKAHASRMADVAGAVPQGNVCYACHPGVQTQCLRDVHAGRQMTCNSCHAGGTTNSETAMLAVGDSTRLPWVTEPRCGDCHKVQGHEYEQAGVLFRDSKGHGGIYCEACHGSTHALTPATEAADNAQSIALQGFAGPLQKCAICHTSQPDDAFPHRFFTGDAGD